MRPLGKRQVGETLRGSCKSEPRVSETAAGHSTGCTTSQRQLCRGGPKTFLSQLGSTAKWVVEIFSGSAHLSKACAEYGFNAIAYDITYGSNCNFLHEQVFRSMLQFIVQHKVVLVWMGMPCSSWSRARRFDGGPPPLRNHDVYLWGCPRLGPADSAKVEQGNQLLAQTGRLARRLQLNGIPWIIENPSSSRCWLTDVFQSLLATGAHLCQVDFCQYRPWRKSTGLLCSSFDALGPALLCCRPRHAA